MHNLIHKRISSYLESALMTEITVRVIFVLIPIAPGKQPVQEACDFPFSVVKEQQVKSQLDLGVEPGGKGNMDLTSKHRWNHFFPSSPGPSSAGSQWFPFLGSSWLLCGAYTLSTSGQGMRKLATDVLRNIHWRPRVCCKPHKNLFVFWKRMPQKITKDHKQEHLKWY